MKVGRESSRAEVRAGTQLGGQRSRMRPRAPRHGDGGGGPGPSCGERGSGAWFSLSAMEALGQGHDVCRFAFKRALCRRRTPYGGRGLPVRQPRPDRLKRSDLGEAVGPREGLTWGFG